MKDTCSFLELLYSYCIQYTVELLQSMFLIIQKNKNSTQFQAMKKSCLLKGVANVIARCFRRSYVHKNLSMQWLASYLLIHKCMTDLNDVLYSTSSCFYYCMAHTARRKTQVRSPAVRLRLARCTAWVKRWSEAMDFLQTIFITNSEFVWCLILFCVWYVSSLQMLSKVPLLMCFGLTYHSTHVSRFLIDPIATTWW